MTDGLEKLVFWYKLRPVIPRGLTARRPRYLTTGLVDQLIPLLFPRYKKEELSGKCNGDPILIDSHPVDLHVDELTVHYTGKRDYITRLQVRKVGVPHDVYLLVYEITVEGTPTAIRDTKSRVMRSPFYDSLVNQDSVVSLEPPLQLRNGYGDKGPPMPVVGSNCHLAPLR